MLEQGFARWLAAVAFSWRSVLFDPIAARVLAELAVGVGDRRDRLDGEPAQQATVTATRCSSCTQTYVGWLLCGYQSFMWRPEYCSQRYENQNTRHNNRLFYPL
jgi:hypothetical protein